MTHILNYTSGFETNYYGINITQSGTYRFNLNYDPIQSYSVYFELEQFGSSSESYVFNVENITQTLVMSLDTGHYRLRVEINQNSFAIPRVYTLWYTSQYELQGAFDVGISSEIYGVVSSSSVDEYHFTAAVDEVVWFLGSAKVILVSITGNGLQNLVGTYTSTKLIYQSSNMTYTPAGDYTFTVMASSTEFHDYMLTIYRIEPDSLENSTNSRNNPYPVTPDYFDESFSLNVPYDVDWFSITVPTESQAAFPHQENMIITVYNGTDIVPLTPDGPGWFVFNATATTYTVEISTTTFVPQYHMVWEYGTAGTTNTYRAVPSTETSISRLKIGYSFVDVLGLMLLPMMMLHTLRVKKFKN